MHSVVFDCSSNNSVYLEFQHCPGFYILNSDILYLFFTVLYCILYIYVLTAAFKPES